jgi:hypothetical protein
MYILENVPWKWKSQIEFRIPYDESQINDTHVKGNTGA